MIIKSKFKPAWWLANSHLQTIWGTATRRKTPLRLRRERITLPDGDFLDLDWAETQQTRHERTPIVLVLHGLGGSIDSHYARGILSAIMDQGWRGAFMHFRGASGTPNRLARLYHSGETDDVNYVANLIYEREPDVKMAAVGYSLGGNVILKWLGETQHNNPLTTAIAISVPFVLEKAANRMLFGVSQFYQWWILSQLRREVHNKFKAMPTPINLSAPIKLEDIAKSKTFWQFDSSITAPLHGFKDAKDYYTKASSRQYLRDIRTNTLIIHAEDDPFMTPEVIPTEKELSDKLILEVSKFGGHVGFVAGSVPGRAEYWLDARVIEHLSQFLSSSRVVIPSPIIELPETEINDQLAE